MTLALLLVACGQSDLLGDPLPENAVARIGTIRLARAGSISSMEFSPDGKVIAAVGGGKSVSLFDAATGARLKDLESTGTWIHSVRFSSNGRRLAAGASGKLFVWDVASGTLAQEFAVEQGGKQLRCLVALGPDGKIAAWGGDDGKLYLWEVDSKKLLTSVSAKSAIECLDISPDGKLLAWGAAKEARVHLLDVKSGAETGVLEGDQQGVRGVWFLEGESRLASWSWDVLRIWNTQTFRPISSTRGDFTGSTLLTISGDGSRAAAATATQRLARLVDAASGATLRAFRVAGSDVSSMTFSRDGKSLACGNTLGEIYRFAESESGDPAQTSPEALRPGKVTRLTFTPDHKGLMTANDDGDVCLWEARSGKPLRASRSAVDEPRSACAFSREGSWVALSTHREIRVVEAATGKVALRLAEGRAAALALTPDGSTLVVGLYEPERLRSWDIKSGKESRTIDFEKGFLTRELLFDCAGTTLAVRGDGAVRCFDWASGKRLAGPPGPATGIFLGTDGGVIGNCVGHSIKLWDVKGGKGAETFSDKTFNYPGCGALSPDGRLVALGGDGGITLLWDRMRKETVGRTVGHGRRGSSRAVALSDDGKLLATADSWGDVLVWDVEALLRK